METYLLEMLIYAYIVCHLQKVGLLNRWLSKKNPPLHKRKRRTEVNRFLSLSIAQMLKDKFEQKGITF